MVLCSRSPCTRSSPQVCSSHTLRPALTQVTDLEGKWSQYSFTDYFSTSMCHCTCLVAIHCLGTLAPGQRLLKWVEEIPHNPGQDGVVVQTDGQRYTHGCNTCKYKLKDISKWNTFLKYRYSTQRYFSPMPVKQGWIVAHAPKPAFLNRCPRANSRCKSGIPSRTSRIKNGIINAPEENDRKVNGGMKWQ